MALFNAARLPVQKTYRLISDSNAHIRYLRGPTAKRNPDVRLKFKNEAANGLGMQLPKGVMQAYGQGRFLGEDRIRHTPKGEDVSIAIGRAVDVTAKRRRTDYRIQGLPKGTAEVAYQITLRNAKSQDLKVDVVERMIGERQILSQSLPHIKDTNQQAVWPVSVPVGGEVSLRYKTRVRFH
ncbi:MAG: hypothetical protein VYB59_03060 [Pseudomonadota bacterium]|nr:hypothetical protein [Pseudomonadota bacterium]